MGRVEPGNETSGQAGSLAYLPLVVESLLVSWPFLTVMDVPECVVAGGDALWVVNLEGGREGGREGRTDGRREGGEGEGGREGGREGDT